MGRVYADIILSNLVEVDPKYPWLLLYLNWNGTILENYSPIYKENKLHLAKNTRKFAKICTGSKKTHFFAYEPLRMW